MDRDSQCPPSADVGILLPGTGSDAQFAWDAFGSALASIGVRALAVEPDPYALVAGYENALDDAARLHGPILIGGISIGAAVAVSWAARNPTKVAAVLLALPAWTDRSSGSAAALSASVTASAMREHGLDHVTASMIESTPPWLATTLARSWASQWPGLPNALEAAANYTGPTEEDLRSMRVPAVVIGAVDDPIHPIEVARRWHGSIAGAHLETVALADIGSNPGVIGSRCVRTLTQAGQLPSC